MLTHKKYYELREIQAWVEQGTTTDDDFRDILRTGYNKISGKNITDNGEFLALINEDHLLFKNMWFSKTDYPNQSFRFYMVLEKVYDEGGLNLVNSFFKWLM